MSMSKFLLSLIRPREKDDDKNEERVYSGAALTEQQRLRLLVLEEVDVLLQKWEEYGENVRMNNLSILPMFIPNSNAYEQLMQRKAWSRTLVGRVSGGLEKLKQAATVPPKRNKRTVRAEAIIAGVAAAFALGLALGQTQLHGSRTNEKEPS